MGLPTAPLGSKIMSQHDRPWLVPSSPVTFPTNSHHVPPHLTHPAPLHPLDGYLLKQESTAVEHSDSDIRVKLQLCFSPAV